MKEHKRILIYPKDVQQLTGKSLRWSQKLIAKIKVSLNKLPGSYITVDEFCVHMGFPKEQVAKYLE